MADLAYCSLTEVLEAAHLAGAQANTHRDALMTSLITRVSVEIDRQTGTWFDKRTKTLYIDPVNPRAQVIFAPTPIVTISSIVEAGTALTYKDWRLDGAVGIRRSSGFWATGAYDDGTTLRGAVKIIGDFGYAAVPKNIAGFAALTVAVLSGYLTRSYTDAETRIERAVTVTTLPDWVKQGVAGQMWLDLSGQRVEGL